MQEACRKDHSGKKKTSDESDRKHYQKKLKLLEREKTDLYEKYKEGRFSRDDYLMQKRECDAKMEEYRKLLSPKETEAEDSAGGTENAERESVAKLIQQHPDLDKLTPEIQQ